MGLFATPTQPQETAETVVNRIKATNLAQYNQRVMFVKNTFNMTWKNPRFTAKQIVDAMGTDAVAMFTAHGTEQAALAALAQQNGLTYEPCVPPYVYTANEDGSITVDMNTPYVPGN